MASFQKYGDPDASSKNSVQAPTWDTRRPRFDGTDGSVSLVSSESLDVFVSAIFCFGVCNCADATTARSSSVSIADCGQPAERRSYFFLLHAEKERRKKVKLEASKRHKRINQID